jgi:short-subunit dehydrogenase
METIYTMITGGLGGLGSTFADECARQGKNLLLVDRYPDGGELVSYLVQKYGVKINYFSCDLSNESDRQSLLTQLFEDKFIFNGLINIVGQEFEGPFLDRSREELLYLLNLNIEAMVDLSQNILRYRDIHQKFIMINIASMAGFFPMPNKLVYAASKRFIINFSLGLREEIREFGNVTVVCPAGLPTNAESMKKIFLQGFWGKLTAQDTTFVVKKAMQKVKRNVPIYIPGLTNRFLVWFSKFLPQSWLARYLSKRWVEKQSHLDLWRVLNKN